MAAAPDITETPTALRVRHRPRKWIIAAGTLLGFAGALAATNDDAFWLRVRIVAAGALAGVLAGAWARRDRCSACDAALPLTVFDDACPHCRRVITGVEDDDRRTALPRHARPGAPADQPKSTAPYRHGSVAARDAAEDAQDLAVRTDVDGHKKRLRNDPQIARALRDHDEDALFHLIRERKKKARSIAEQAAIDAFLADPRRHLDPKKRPWLGVRAGTGLVLAGARDQDPEDGSFVAEQMLVLGTYAITPIASYVARRREQGGVEILGRVPLPFWKRLWRAAVMLPVAVVLALGVQAFVASRSSKVHFVNGLDVPVTVHLGADVVRVEPHAREVRELGKGARHLVARDDHGALIEELDLEVPGGDAFLAYDVLGATALVAREHYYTNKTVDPADLHYEMHIGLRVLAKDRADYPFVEAPTRIPANGDLRTWQITQLPRGWRGAVQELREEGSQRSAASLLEAVSLAEPENEDAVTEALDAIVALDGLDAAKAHLTKLSARSPGSAAVRAAAERLQRARP